MVRSPVRLSKECMSMLRDLSYYDGESFESIIKRLLDCKSGFVEYFIEDVVSSISVVCVVIDDNVLFKSDNGLTSDLNKVFSDDDILGSDFVLKLDNVDLFDVFDNLVFGDLIVIGDLVFGCV